MQTTMKSRYEQVESVFKGIGYTIGIILGLGFTIMAMPFIIMYALYKEFIKNNRD